MRVCSERRVGVHALACGQGPQSGIAIIIVLISIFVLTVLAGGFAYSMKVETRLAQNANSEAELEWLGRSGVEYAKWILAEQLKIPQEPYDALNQVWAGGQGGIGTSNSSLATVQREIELGNGKFTWKIVDLERKANINVADQQLLSQALTVIGVDAGDQTPVGCILDWIDPNPSSHHPDGAKDDFYHAQNPPYDCKNGPIDDLSELLFVKGVTPELYWGDFSTNHPPAAFQGHVNKFGLAVTYPYGLADLFTPLSDGRINVNTASAEVLELIPGVTPQVAQAIVSGREGEDDGSGLLGPYKSVQGVERVPAVPRGMGAALQAYCDVRSRTFEVTVDAEVGGYKRQFVAVLGRNNPRDVQILTFYWK